MTEGQKTAPVKRCRIKRFHSQDRVQCQEKRCAKRRCRPSVIVVDDDATCREVLVAYSGLMGFKKVRVATNVAEAVVLIEAEVPCMIVSDINMPGGIGTELEGLYPSIPIVYVSGGTDGQQPGRIILDKSLDPLTLLAGLALATAKHHCDGSRYGCLDCTELMTGKKTDEENDEKESGSNT